MKIQTKIGLGLIPLVLLSIIILGAWSVRITTSGIDKSALQHMNTILDYYVDDKIRGMHQLLVRNLLDKEESFVKDYQQLAAESANEFKLTKAGHIFALDAEGKFVFCSKKVDPQLIESLWGEHAVSIANGSTTKLTGHLYALNTRAVYAARYFQPWKWVVFYASSGDEIRAAQQSIKNAAILIAVFSAAASWLLLFLVIRKYLIKPIQSLQKAASAIAEGNPVGDINIHSQDEVGDLSRNMELMAKAIQKHRAEQMVWQEKLEKEVKTLGGLLPICSYCKKIRDDKGYWNQIEAYIQENSEAQFSHGICQECAEKHYPGMDLYGDDET